MSHFLLWCFVVFIIFCCVDGQVFVRGQSCPDLPVVKNFQPDRYLGRWFEQENFPFRQDQGLSCITAKYEQNNDGTINVVNSGFDKPTGRITSSQATATLGRFEKAKLTVSFNQFAPPGSYWVLDTDYCQYAVVWSCSNVQDGRQETAWILTRDPNGLTNDLTWKLKMQTLAQYGIDINSFERSDQKDCFYLV